MEYGMPTLIENENIYENIRLCKELGLSFIELNMNLVEYQIEGLENTEIFASLARENGIYFTIHLDEKFIMGLESKLVHFHLHDSKGTKDHMTLGTGEVDLTQRIGLAGKLNCRGVVETKTITALKESVGWLRDNHLIELR